MQAIGFYKTNLSHLLMPCCKHVPTCSEYMIIAVKKYGVLSGLGKGALRLLRCNPFVKSRFDFP